MVDRRRLRHHVYDSGNSTFGSRGAGPEILHSEGNGLAYACGGGFIDIAHVRDYADTALYFAGMSAVSMIGDEGREDAIDLWQELAELNCLCVCVACGVFLVVMMNIYFVCCTCAHSLMCVCECKSHGHPQISNHVVMTTMCHVFYVCMCCVCMCV